MSVRYYDRQGKPMGEVLAWAKKLEDPTYKLVAKTELPNGVMISTVWLGLDHSFRKRPPLIFETMVFGENAAQGDQYQERYTTEALALIGHQTAVDIELAALNDY